MVDRIRKIKTLEQKILLLKKEAATDLKKRIKQQEKEIFKLGQEYTQTFDEDFNFSVCVKKNQKSNTKNSSGSRARLTKQDKIKVEDQITKLITKTPHTISGICDKTKRPVNQIRNILKNIKGLKKKGSKRNTTYFVK